MPWDYQAPWRDMRFVIEDVLRLPEQWARLPAFDGVDAELASQVLDEAARFAREVLLPINASADLEGCRLEGGHVRTPRGYREAYAGFVDGGWPALAMPRAIGGQGLPQVLNAAICEMFAACNHGWTMYSGVLHGAVETLHHHADPATAAELLPSLVTGRWLATMALTEPQAGSDLGRISTRAQPTGVGRFALHGTKIFISGGDHDLTERIVHLVLARLPDAPPGTKGLSLFVTEGNREGVHCDGLEHKLGLKGSATCTLRFEGAPARLVGEPHRGLAAMFTMMNSARLHVGLQGLGHAEAAAQNARRHALEREQGGGPIANHPAVASKLDLLEMRARGGRLLAYQAAHWIDLAAHGNDADAERARSLAAVVTPVVKAYLTHHGFACASEALQVFGGYGYVHETGIEQALRDVRIAMIYEGTNEIQAIDLLVRKGALQEVLWDELERSTGDDRVLADVSRLREVYGRVAAATDARLACRVADDWLHATGALLLRHGFARRFAAAQGDDASAREQRALAETAEQRLRREFEMHLAAVEAE
jgi:alkylation response protein AidB-like acyl-CoA dehydrogenase